MKESYDNKLTRTFPNLYKNRYADMRTTAMCWGFDTGLGWMPLIWDLSIKLEYLANTKYPDLTAVQVKEKFGGLRFYVSPHYDEVQNFIDAAEKLSYKTCDVCGLPGKSREGGWIVTRCDKHVDIHGEDEDKLHWTVLLKHYRKNWRYYL